MTLIKFKNGGSNLDRPLIPSFIGDFFSDFMNTDLMTRDVFRSVPAVNISETPEKFMVDVAAPGMEKKDFKIEVENGILRISVEKKSEVTNEDQKFTRKEFSYTSFDRTFTLPEQVNAEAITAEYENGVLKLQLPKREEAKKKPVREITVS